MKATFALVAVGLCLSQTASAAGLDRATCQLLTERLDLYAALMDDLVFLPFENITDSQISDWYRKNVSNRTLTGELERISDARKKLDDMCR
ncbi:hypothetical protein [Rhizobium brockwellii]